jgi:hypothetical protein
MHELLIRRRGHAAALAVLLHAVLQGLFLAGTIDFAARINSGCASEAASRVVQGHSTPLCQCSRVVAHVIHQERRRHVTTYKAPMWCASQGLQLVSFGGATPDAEDRPGGV